MGRTYDVTTFIKLPHRNLTIKDCAGTDIVVNTFLGNDDIHTYSSAKFQTVVLDITRQCKVAGPQQASFGMTDAILKVDDFDFVKNTNKPLLEIIATKKSHLYLKLCLVLLLNIKTSLKTSFIIH